MEHRTIVQVASQFDRQEDDRWKLIWKLPCPKKLQMFIWRMKHEALAPCTNLERRGMVLVNNKCYYCSRATEDGGHLFVKCKAVKEVWRALNLENERGEMEK